MNSPAVHPLEPSHQPIIVIEGVDHSWPGRMVIESPQPQPQPHPPVHSGPTDYVPDLDGDSVIP